MTNKEINELLHSIYEELDENWFNDLRHMFKYGSSGGSHSCDDDDEKREQNCFLFL